MIGLKNNEQLLLFFQSCSVFLWPISETNTCTHACKKWQGPTHDLTSTPCYVHMIQKKWSLVFLFSWNHPKYLLIFILAKTNRPILCWFWWPSLKGQVFSFSRSKFGRLWASFALYYSSFCWKKCEGKIKCNFVGRGWIVVLLFFNGF